MCVCSATNKLIALLLSRKNNFFLFTYLHIVTETKLELLKQVKFKVKILWRKLYISTAIPLAKNENLLYSK